MIKILILVLTYDDNGGYSMMDKIVRETWGNQKFDNVEVYYYYSKPLENQDYIVEGDSIFCNGLESYHTIGYKTLTSFKFLLSKDFDYLFRTNSSSFIHLPNLLKYLENKPKHNFYSGVAIPVHRDNMSLEVGSGSGYILSKDIVELVVNHESEWEHNHIDDLAIGKLLKNHNVDLIPNNWFKLNQPPNENILNLIGDIFHIRCKIEDRCDINTQVEIFKTLNKIIYKK